MTRRASISAALLSVFTVFGDQTDTTTKSFSPTWENPSVSFYGQDGNRLTITMELSHNQMKVAWRDQVAVVSIDEMMKELLTGGSS